MKTGVVRGIILAAGESIRMGCDKLVLPWRESTVLQATLENWVLVQQINEIFLVRRKNDLVHQWPRVRVLVNTAASEGMGSSLRLAARALPSDTDAVAVGLADMPEIKSETIAALIEAWYPLGPDGIVAPVFNGRRGHPVVFGANHLQTLRTLGGDSGARAILQDRASDLLLFTVDDPGVLLDLDLPADLRTPS